MATTPNLNLEIPTLGSAGWAEKFNANFVKIDEAIGPKAPLVEPPTPIQAKAALAITQADVAGLAQVDTPTFAGITLGDMTLFVGGIETNLVPQMTTPTTPSGLATASSFFGTFFPFTAFNSNASQGWCNATGQAWIQYRFDSPKVVTAYEITPPFESRRTPLSWAFLGSNDGADWTELDHRDIPIATWVQDVPRRFDFANGSEYAFYRLMILENGGDAYTGIRGLSLLGIDASAPRLLLRDGAGKIHEIALVTPCR